LGDETDTVRLRRGAYSAVKYNLAGRLASPFQKPITPELAAEISAANKALLRMTVRLGDVAQPATLPMGTGNDRDQYNDRFFPEKNKSNW